MLDLSMLELHNAKKRSSEDWTKLFGDTDPRFKFLGAKRPAFSRSGIIEALLGVVIDACSMKLMYALWHYSFFESLQLRSLRVPWDREAYSLQGSDVGIQRVAIDL